MSNTLLEETFIYGNLELVYSNKKIKTFSIDTIINLVDKCQTLELGKFWFWRFYKNYKIIINNFENYNLNKNAIFYKLIDLANHIVLLAKHKGIELIEIKTIIEHTDSLAILFILKELNIRLKHMVEIEDCEQNRAIRSYYKGKFDDLINHYKKKFLVCDYTIPFENNTWSPSWGINYENIQEIIEGVDLYIDNYFLHPDIRFNLYMSDDIPMLIDRLSFLQKNATLYYNDHIKPRINKLSKNIYDHYPYKLIYTEYFELALNYEMVHIPNLLKYISLDKINKDIWLLSILPRYLTAYLLGFPVISCDVPSEKNIIKIFNKIIEIGLEQYWQEIYQQNKEMLRLKSMNIDCGNNYEEGSILDLTFNQVEKYNSDDTILFFNEGVYHIFTYPEFDDIISKERNPYNRNPMPLLTNIVSSLKFKKKIRRQLNYRYLDIKLDSTMEENLKHIKERINQDLDYSIKFNFSHLTNSLFNMLLNGNN